MTVRTAVPGSGGTGDTTGNTWDTTAIDSLSGGWIADVQVTSDSSTFTNSDTTLFNSGSVTVGTSRRILVMAYGRFGSDVANDDLEFRIEESGTVLNATTVNLPKVVATSNYGCPPVMAVLTPSAGAHTYTVNAIRHSGSGNCILKATATGPAGILVIDLGPA